MQTEIIELNIHRSEGGLEIVLYIPLLWKVLICNFHMWKVLLSWRMKSGAHVRKDHFVPRMCWFITEIIQFQFPFKTMAFSNLTQRRLCLDVTDFYLLWFAMVAIQNQTNWLRVLQFPVTTPRESYISQEAMRASTSHNWTLWLLWLSQRDLSSFSSFGFSWK